MNEYAKLSDLLSEDDTRPLIALCNAVASARSEEGSASSSASATACLRGSMVDGAFWWTVDSVAAARREWAWALVYFLEWVRRDLADRGAP